MEPVRRCAAQRGQGAPGGFAGGQFLKPYDSFIRTHLRFYGYFRDKKTGREETAMSQGKPSGQHPKASTMGNTSPGWQRGPGHEPNREPQAAFALSPPRWPVECEVIQETIEHIDWVPPKPEPFCPPMGPEQPLYTLGEEQGTVVYHSSPALQGSCFIRARVGGAPGPLSSPAAPLEGPQDTTLLFESRFESGNLQKAIKVGPYEYVLMLRPDLYTAKHTQWFYFRVQNTRQEPLYRFTIANMAKPKSLYGQGLQPLLYSQRDAQSHGIGWRRVGTDIRYRRGSMGEPPVFRLSWTVRFPHDGDTCFFAAGYPYTYSELQRYLRALAADPARSRYCTVQALCRSLAGNTVYLLTITSPGGTAGKRVVVVSARAHPGESGGSWAMRGFLNFLLSPHADAQLLRRLFVFKVVPMLNPDGVVVGNSRCSLAGRDPNRAYGLALPGSFPGVWHLRAMVQRVLAEREVVLYCDFHGHSRKNNVFMYGCDAGVNDTGTRLHQRVFPLMLSKNAPDKVGQGCLRAMCCSGSGNAATVPLPELSLRGWDPSDPGAPSSLSPAASSRCRRAKRGQAESPCGVWASPTATPWRWLSVAPRWVGGAPTLAWRTWSPWAASSVTPCLTSATLRPPRWAWTCPWVVPWCRGTTVTPALSHSCSSAWWRRMRCCSSRWVVSQALEAAGGMCPPQSLSPVPVAPTALCPTGSQMEPCRRKRLRRRRARNALCRTNRSHTSIPAGTRRHPVLPGVQSGGGSVAEKPRASSRATFPRAAGAGNGTVPGAGSGVALPRAPEAGNGCCATMGRHQPDSGTSAVARRKPPLSPCHRGATSAYSRDPAVGRNLGPSWQRGSRTARDSTRPLTVPAVASRCSACARQ
ncbi:cytosolic carboxypeptidase 2 isoform X2 [Chamaea fasciata]|uniref:cytosolic carboxypeptidase 2 isoform X2 n=1 Tax=Chamaea fasciata TaxID=190680 RepID=UPI00336A9B6B